MATLNLRLDDDSKAAIAEAAALRGVNITEYVRAVLVAQAKREVAGAQAQTLVLTAAEQLELWNALQAPVALTSSQQELGRLMRGDG